MCRSPWIAAVLAALGLSAHAAEGVDLSMKSMAVASAAATPARQTQAPFAGRRDPWAELMVREEQELRGPRGGCEVSSSDLCYDLADARVVYRPARRYMPALGSLTPENVSLRPNRIVFKYSFR